ncbi:MAG: AraC family transcriptional regulator [Bacteroidetes bacterium]|nr:MAG: AraC family transcriptional regulator [Bacteroidota bacterium]
MDNYNKIVDSLTVRFVNAQKMVSIKAIQISNYHQEHNSLILLHEGNICFGKDSKQVKEGEILFLSANKAFMLELGSKGSENVINNDEFNNLQSLYLQTYSNLSASNHTDNFSIFNFQAKIFDSVGLFSALEIPPFVLQSAKISRLMQEIINESNNQEVGKNRLIHLISEQIIIELFRQILRNQLFAEKIIINSPYFKDPRLADMFNYIKKNLNSDLSNKVLANLINVSEDYVGQYFKMLTGINPQDYIEYQRMEKALVLLQSTKLSISEIGAEIGYKDTTYFCKRFKMRFATSPGQKRKK